MRLIFTISCLLAILWCNDANADARRHNLKNIDKPIELDAGSSPRMYVIFNHSTHKSVKCRTCHHTGLPGNRYAPCTSPGCHSLQGARHRTPDSLYMAYHAPDTDVSCYGCHKSLADKYPQFNGCRPCHMTPMGRKMAEEAKNSPF